MTRRFSVRLSERVLKTWPGELNYLLLLLLGLKASNLNTLTKGRPTWKSLSTTQKSRVVMERSSSRMMVKE